ncbi:MAG: hypothetical protein KDA79_20395, partial [Planctomycetaceae bacterium]|nr:hypothetical protein [Planctomycetaceae bacterium]
WMWRAWHSQGKQVENQTAQLQGWRLNQVSRWQILGDALRLLLLRDRIDSLTLDDPAPFLHEAAGLLCWPMRRISKSQVNRRSVVRSIGRPVPSPADLQNAHQKLIQRVEN